MMKHLILTVAMTIAATAALAETGGSLWWGYYHGTDVPDNNLGVSKEAVYEAAIHVDGQADVVRGTTIEAVRLPLNDATHIDSLTLWLTTDLEQQERLATVIVGEPRSGWNVVSLPQPIALPAEGVYVGYTFKVTELDGQSERPLVMCNDLNDGGLWLRVQSLKQYRDWYNTRRYGSLAMQLQLSGGELRATMATVDAVRSNNVVRRTADQLDVMFSNYGTDPIRSLQFTYTFGDETLSGSYDLAEPLANVYGAQAYAAVPVVAPEATGRMPLSFTLTGVNGQPNGNTAATATTDVISLAHKAHHRTVMEEYTGTWCSACPRGFAGIARLKTMYPDDFIAISVHVLNGDPMDVYYDYYYVMNATQFPCCRFDRGDLTDPYDGDLTDGHFHADVNFRAANAILAPADIEVEARWTGDSTCSVSSTVSFAYDADQCDYKLAYILTEDSLRGPEGDHAWHQMNSFSNPVMSYYVEDDMQQYVNAEGSMIDDVAYNDVVIAMSDVRGIEGSLSGEQRVGQPMTHTTELRLTPVSQHRRNVHIVALLIDAKTKRVANAATCTVSGATDGILETFNDQWSMSNGQCSMSDGAYDICGRKLSGGKWSNSPIVIVRQADGSVRKLISTTNK